MMKLIKANLRHNKFNMIAVMVLIIIATTLICVGVSIAFKAPVLYDEKTEQLGENTFGLNLAPRKSVTYPLVLERFMKCPQIETVIQYTSLSYAFDNVTKSNQSGKMNLYFSDIEKIDEFKPRMLKEKQVDGNAVYANVSNAHLGEKYTMTLGGKTMEFEVAGVYESVMNPWGTNEMFVNTETYNLIAETFGAGETMIVLKGNLIDNSIETFNKAYDYFVKTGDPYFRLEAMLIPGYTGIGYSVFALYGIKLISENFLYILSSLLILFAFVVMAIALIITRFTITTGIDDNIRNLGVLKAIGAETKTLRMAYLLQYLVMAFIAAVIGICVAFASKGFFVSILYMATSVNFIVPMNAGAIFIALAVILATVLLTVYLSTNRVRKIMPITALRRGVSTHSFKKNHIPLDKTRVNPNVALAVKSVVNNKKQSVVVIVIVAITAFLSAFSSVLYYNMNLNTHAMYSILGEDTNHYTVYNENMNIDEILAIDGVDGYSTLTINRYDMIKIGSITTVQGQYSQDYSQFRISSIYAGRYPTADNEVAISSKIKNATGADIGDFIDIYSNNSKKTEKFMVTGFVQNMDSSNIALFTIEGMERLTNVSVKDLNRSIGWKIYLKENADEQSIRKLLIEKYGIEKVNLVREHIESDLLGTLAPASAALLGVMVGVTVIIIAMLLLLIIKIKLQRERRNYAVFKAQGYTTGNIISQVTLSMFILTFIGAFIGVILGAVLCSPLLKLVLMGYGIMKVELLINWGFIIAVMLVINIVAVVASAFLSLKTKYISLRDLANDV